jgi:molecular chaperone HscB
MDPFATLGLPRRYEIDMAELEARYRELQRALHPDKHAGAAASARRLSLENAILVNEAYRTLRDDVLRAQALLGLYQSGGGGDVGSKADTSATTTSATNANIEEPEFLMEMLELREALGEAKEARDQARVAQLQAQVEAMRDQARDGLSAAFAELDRAEVKDAPLARASALLGRLKYFRRFLEHVAGDDGEPA